MFNNRYNADEDPELFNSESFVMLDGSCFLSYTKFHAEAFAEDFDVNRTKWLNEALHHHVLKEYPYSDYNIYERVEDYYDFIAGFIDPEPNGTPWELKQEVIECLINHLDFDNYPRDPVYVYLKVNLIFLKSIEILGKLIWSMNNELKSYFILKILQYIIMSYNKNPRPTATPHPDFMNRLFYNVYKEPFEIQAIFHLYKAIVLCREFGLYFKCLIDNPILKKQLDESGCLEVINKSLQIEAVSWAHFYYPGNFRTFSTINTELAFRLFSELPKWATAEFAQAQFWMAKLICYHSNFTPENFATESMSDKKRRLLAMKAYLTAAADNGHDLAIYERKMLDEELAKFLVKGNRKRKLPIEESKPSKGLMMKSLATNGFFLQASTQNNTSTNESVSPKKLRY